MQLKNHRLSQRYERNRVMNENPYNPPAAQLSNETPAKGALEYSLLSFLRHWNGRAKLLTAFWGHFILGNFLFTLALVVSSRSIQALSSEPNTAASIFQVALAVLSFIYYICTVRFIWACARNSNYSGFFYIIRGLILAFLIFIVSIFAITGYEALSNS